MERCDLPGRTRRGRRTSKRPEPGRSRSRGGGVVLVSQGVPRWAHWRPPRSRRLFSYLGPLSCGHIPRERSIELVLVRVIGISSLRPVLKLHEILLVSGSVGRLEIRLHSPINNKSLQLSNAVTNIVLRMKYLHQHVNEAVEEAG